MKRTTYIMIGMLVTGVAMVCGLMFYVVDRNVTQKDNFMEIGGERKTVQLPSCRVLKLTQPPVVWKQKKEGIVEAERMFSFGEVPLEPAIQSQPRFIVGYCAKLDLGTGGAGGGAIAHGAQPKGQAKQGPWNRCRSIR